MAQVKIYRGAIPNPTSSDFKLQAPDGDLPDGIVTRGAPWLDIIINPVSGVDKFTVMVWGEGDENWAVLDGEIFVVDYDQKPFRHRIRRRLGTGIRFVALQAYDIQEDNGLPVSGSSFDGDDNAVVFIETSYG